MKRDMDLLRKIVLYIENKVDDNPIIESPFNDYDPVLVSEHYHLLYEAGLVRCEVVCSSSTPSRVIRVIPFSLTWEGHEFADSIRNDSIWEKAKSKIFPKIGGVPFDVLKAVLIEIWKEMIK